MPNTLKAVSITICVLLLVGCAPAPLTQVRSVLVAGDSLAGGYYASTKAMSFRSLLIDKLSEGGDVGLIRYGFPHGRLSQIADKAPTEGIDIAVIEIGTNDFGHTPKVEFREDYEGYLTRITTASSGVQLICLGLWNSSSARSNGETPNDYDRIIRDACETHGGTFIPMQPIFDKAATRGPAGVTTEVGESDSFHPNDYGHELIAAAILDIIT